MFGPAVYIAGPLFSLRRPRSLDASRAARTLCQNAAMIVVAPVDAAPRRPAAMEPIAVRPV